MHSRTCVHITRQAASSARAKETAAQAGGARRVNIGNSSCVQNKRRRVRATPEVAEHYHPSSHSSSRRRARWPALHLARSGWHPLQRTRLARERPHLSARVRGRRIADEHSVTLPFSQSKSGGEGIRPPAHRRQHRASPPPEKPRSRQPTRWRRPNGLRTRTESIQSITAIPGPCSSLAPARQ